MTQDRKKIIAEAAEAEAREVVKELGCSNAASELFYDAAFRNGYVLALVRSAERVEGVIEAGKAMKEKITSHMEERVDGRLPYLTELHMKNAADAFDAALNEYQKL